MEITEQDQGALVILQPIGRLDSASAPIFEKKMKDVLDRGNNKILVDLGKLDYISSAGLRVLLMGAKGTQARQGKVTLCAMKPKIREVLEVSGFLSIFTAYETRDAAVAAES